MKHVVKEVKLKNGSAGLLIHVPDASVMTFEINFRAGEYLVERDKWETAHLMEHMLLGANQKIRNARAFQAEFEKNGAYSNASTSTYHITYEAECADFEWDRILELLLIAISKPLFLETEFEAEVGNVREELTGRSNNHFRHLSLALREAEGFLALTDQARLKLMGNVTLDDIRTHYKKTHTSANMRFVVAGDLSDERVKQIERKLLTIELPDGKEHTPLPLEVPVAMKKPLYIHRAEVENFYFYIDTFKCAELTDGELDALGLVNSMLTETLASRILGKAREKGLVYSMGSGFGQLTASIGWWFGAQVRQENAKALFKLIVDEIMALRNGQLTTQDIEEAKQYALGRYQRSGQTVGGTADGYSGRYFWDGHIDDYYKVPERINAVTKEIAVATANKLFEDGIWGFGVLGACGKEFAEELRLAVAPLWQAEE